MLPDHLGSQDVIQVKLNSGVWANCFAGCLRLESFPLLLAGSYRGSRGHLLYPVSLFWLELCRVILRHCYAPTAVQVHALRYSTAVLKAIIEAHSALLD